MAKGLSVCLGVVLLAAAARHGPCAQRGENLLANGGFERGGAGWKPYGGGFAIDERVAHSGRRSLRCTSPDGKTPQGVLQVLTFQTPIEHPFRVSGWSRGPTTPKSAR